MKVLWITQFCTLQDDPGNQSFFARQERVVVEHCRDRIQLAVAFMADETYREPLIRDGISYYPIHARLEVGIDEVAWDQARTALLQVIDDFQPDLIQCFGSEWPYGAIAESTSVPVVIHMMGFLNAYFPAIDMARGASAPASGPLGRIEEAVLRRLRPVKTRPEEYQAAFERRVMAANRYFLGRTRWDENIVRYYSPGARYYRVPEAAKESVYASPRRWRYHHSGKVRLFSLSSGDDRKGNEIILRTAKLLKELIGLDLQWRVAGSPDYFPRYEQRTGIDHRDVNVELLGWIGNRQIVEELCAADLFIHPSILDNSPHAVCEAQLIGCPVIASQVGGVPQHVEDGVTGWLYPYNEPHALAFLIADLYQNEELLSQVSKNEIEISHRRHDPAGIAKALLLAYEDVIRWKRIET